MNKAIIVQNLSKQFIQYKSQRGRFIHMITNGRVKGGTEFWALKNINFDVGKGATFGIIGQNGSGKSTLLSIIAGALQPTTGTSIVNGKTSAILELGSGFHNEFTGRENVYMYGTILGLSRSEIRKRFNAIVDFSELHAFIDRPLFTYSSGMLLRLAFSVVISVDANILIFDEALAVGDAVFQDRCIKKIRELQKEGKTILYVGHDLGIVRIICDAAILLDEGRIVQSGDTRLVADYYHALILERKRIFDSRQPLKKHPAANGDNRPDRLQITFNNNRSIRFGSGAAKIADVFLKDERGMQKSNFRSGERVTLCLKVAVNQDIGSGFNTGFIIRNEFGDVFATNGFWLGEECPPVKSGESFYSDFSFPLNIGPGRYTISTVAQISYSHDDGEMLDWNNDVLLFEVLPVKHFFGSVSLPAKVSRREGNKPYTKDIEIMKVLAGC